MWANHEAADPPSDRNDTSGDSSNPVDALEAARKKKLDFFRALGQVPIL
jgi:hypothetical protein